MSRPRQTPTVILKRLRKSPGECPACKSKLAGNEFKDPAPGTGDQAVELALYACGSVWRFVGDPKDRRFATCDRACSAKGDGVVAEVP